MTSTARVLAIATAFVFRRRWPRRPSRRSTTRRSPPSRVAANQVDVDAGKLALSKAKSADIKQFAQTMVTDHSGAIKAASDLVGKLKVTPKENDTSKALVKGGQDARAKLSKLSGDAFDKAYIDNEVGYHETVRQGTRRHADPERAEQRAQGPLDQRAGCRRRPPRARATAAKDRQVARSPITATPWISISMPGRAKFVTVISALPG